MSEQLCCPDRGSDRVRPVDLRCPLRDVGMLESAVRHHCLSCRALYTRPIERSPRLHTYLGLSSMVLVLGLALFLAVSTVA
jgi:hypothetical protein